ncbi:dissimilatory sulfite reductase alpha subunit, partial [Candidatus Magnetoovum chiemensis]
EELYDLVDKIWEWWDENGKNRERVGRWMERLTFPRFLKDVGLDPHPAMVKEPRRDPFFFWSEEDIVKQCFCAMSQYSLIVVVESSLGEAILTV